MFQSGPDPDRLRALAERAAREVDQGRLPSCQLAVAHEGRVVLDLTCGAPDTARYVLFSVTKALVAAAVWRLIGTGQLAAERAVVDLVPAFATNGKDTVTVGHLLTHTAGFPRAPMRPEDGADPERRAARFASWRLDWPPGTRTEYHPTSAHWVLADLVERAAGMDYRTFVTSAVTEPLGLPGLRLGLPAAEQSDVLDVAVVGDAPSADRELGAHAAEIGPVHLLRFNEASVRAVGVPGAGATGRAADVALLFQGLLRNPDRLWDARALADGTAVVHNALLDPWLGVPANRTLGLVVAGADGNAVLRGFPPNSGPRAFGATGVGGQVAWADPDQGLSFCFLTNGLDADVVNSFSRTAKLSALAVDSVGRVAGARR